MIGAMKNPGPESLYAMRHFILVRYRTICDDAVLKTGSGESRSWVRIPPPPPTSHCEHLIASMAHENFGACIVLGKTSIQIVGSADVGSISVFAGTAENVNEAFHSAVFLSLR
jgi:hypothetical protein